MASKACFKCGVDKPLSEFYKHPQMADGHLNKCKECTKADTKTNYADKREQYSEYDRQRSQRPERKAKVADYLRKMRTTNPEKGRARNAVSNALRDGRLQRGPCEVCGTTEGVEAHHHDYSKPLDVQWFCFKHHRGDQHGNTIIRPDWKAEKKQAEQ